MNYLLVVQVFVRTPLGSDFSGIQQPNAAYTPRYLIWWRNPLRKISWDFDGYIGGRGGGGKPVELIAFSFRLKVNRGDGIKIEKAYIESRPKGFRQDLVIDRLPATIHEGEQRITSSYIQSNHWHRFHSRFEDWTKEQLVEHTTGLRLVVEYDGKKFVQTFSQKEMFAVVDRFWSYCNRTSLSP